MKIINIILKLFIILIITSAVLLILNIFYTNTNYYKELYNLKQFSTIKKNCSIINLGSSVGKDSFDYSSTGLNGCNFGFDLQDFYYDYSLLNQYSPCLKENCYVIIPCTYFSFSIVLDDKNDQYNLIVPRYYRILTKKYIKKYAFTNLVIYKYLPILSLDIKDYTKYLITKTKNNENMITKEDKVYIDAYEKRIKESDPETTLYNKALLIDMINYCYKNNFVPILMLTPYKKSFVESFLDDYKKMFYDNITDVKDSTGVLFLDYSQDQRITRDLSLFKNATHLNKNGAIEFTKMLINDLESMLPLKN